jgi:hypothetical protein
MKTYVRKKNFHCKPNLLLGPYHYGKNHKISFKNYDLFFHHKVKKILKVSLDLIPSPSPSVKIQIMGRKIYLMGKGKTLLGIVNKLFVSKRLLKTPSNVYLYAFPAHNLNFHLRRM